MRPDKHWSAIGMKPEDLIGRWVCLPWTNGLHQQRYNYGHVWWQVAANFFHCGGYGWTGNSTREDMMLLEDPTKPQTNSHGKKEP